MKKAKRGRPGVAECYPKDGALTKTIRENAGLSRRALGLQASVSEATIRRFESGLSVTSPTRDLIMAQVRKLHLEPFHPDTEEEPVPPNEPESYTAGLPTIELKDETPLEISVSVRGPLAVRLLNVLEAWGIHRK